MVMADNPFLCLAKNESGDAEGIFGELSKLD